MELILTSKDFLNDKIREVIFDNINDISKCKILFIPSGKVTMEDYQSDKYYKRLEDYGFLRENIFVLNYYDISKYINLDIDVIYVGGGNTFKLLDRIRKSGFDKYLIKYIENGVVYIGGSAGTHIVTKNIEHIKPFDENDINMSDFNALGLFDGIIFCHYTDDRKAYVDKALKLNKYNVYTLRDDEYIIYEK